MFYVSALRRASRLSTAAPTSDEAVASVPAFDSVQKIQRPSRRSDSLQYGTLDHPIPPPQLAKLSKKSSDAIRRATDYSAPVECIAFMTLNPRAGTAYQIRSREMAEAELIAPASFCRGPINIKTRTTHLASKSFQRESGAS
jgi:hypothetical protein